MLAMFFRGTKKFARSWDDLGDAANIKTAALVGDMYSEEKENVAKYNEYKTSVAATES